MSDAPSTPSAYPAQVDTAAVSVTFELEHDELPRLMMALTLRRSWFVAFALFVAILCLEALKQAAPEPPSWTRAVAWPPVFGMMALGVLAWIGWRQGARHRDTVAVYQNPQTFVFTPGQVTQSGKGVETTFDLAVCHGVTESATHFTIWVTFASAYFVPLRAFADGIQVAQVRAWFREGMPGTAKVKLRG